MLHVGIEQLSQRRWARFDPCRSLPAWSVLWAPAAAGAASALLPGRHRAWVASGPECCEYGVPGRAFLGGFSTAQWALLFMMWSQLSCCCACDVWEHTGTVNIHIWCYCRGLELEPLSEVIICWRCGREWTVLGALREKTARTVRQWLLRSGKCPISSLPETSSVQLAHTRCQRMWCELSCLQPQWAKKALHQGRAECCALQAWVLGLSRALKVSSSNYKLLDLQAGTHSHSDAETRLLSFLSQFLWHMDRISLHCKIKLALNSVHFKMIK